MSSTIKIAIDPGQSGGIAVRYPDGSVTAEKFDCEAGMIEVLEGILTWDATRHTEAVLERVHAMPREGVSSVFKFGANYGFWRGALQALRIPFREVTPQAWQTGIGLASGLQGPNRKRALKQIASERHPKIKVTLATADCLLMLDA